MKNEYHLVELLVNEYRADVNAIAADGTQPIHLACFYLPLDEARDFIFRGELGIQKIKILVKANANVDVEFGQEIFSKHVKNREWCPDFGDKMPLAAYAVIYDKPSIIHHLKKVNLDIRSLTNKTLLIYAVENTCYEYTSIIMSNVEDPELMDKLINHRDNDDVPLTHDSIHPKEFGKFQYDDDDISAFDNIFMNSTFIYLLTSWGADKFALINNNPATFLPNLSAYRGCPMLLQYFLPYYTCMSLPRVLYYATLPIDEESEHLICFDSEAWRDTFLRQIRSNREGCIEIALRDLVFRRVFRLPVPKEEIKLMDELIASDENLREFVDNFKRNFIEKELQECFIEIGDNKITVYDLVMQVFDCKKLKSLARKENLLNALDALDNAGRQSDDFYRFYEAYQLPIKTRIENARERLRSLENLKKISSLREAIPLPFELILDIVEYLNNEQLNVFIQAFYAS